MTIEKAMADLGVTSQTLFDDERRSLDERGYVLLLDAIHQPALQRLQDEYDHPTPFALNPDDKFTTEVGADRQTNMEYKSPIFDAAWTNPRHLAAVHHVLRGAFRLYTINARDPLQGHGHQALHRDASRAEDGRIQAVQSLYMLDDFTPENGATRIIPGTHFQDDARFVALPSDGSATHPDQILLTAPAGSIAVFNSHLIHGGTRNISGARRRVLHSTYVPAWRETPERVHRETITPEMRRRLSPAHLFLLGV